MLIEKYQLKANENYEAFRFVSEGEKTIEKIIVFQQIEVNVYSLGFGDWDGKKINDKIVSNNGDTEKVLATVADAVLLFGSKHENAVIFAQGSTPARTRLYQMGIHKYFEEINIHFYVLGKIDEVWSAFDKKSKYESFMIIKK